MSTRIYTVADLVYIKKFSAQITLFAAQMGVSATAVAAAIAKENSAYNQHREFDGMLDA